MASINPALAQVKLDHKHLLSSKVILRFALALQHEWRDRQLGPAETIQLFILQVLHGNAAINALRRLTTIPFTDSAYVQARQRLPVQLFRDLVKWIGLQASAKMLVKRGDNSQLFHGHRVHILDGSNASMPDTSPLQKFFGQPPGQKAGCGFPAAHLLYLLDLATGMITDLTISPLFTHDLRHATSAHDGLAAGDLIMGDRAFASFAHIALIRRHQMHILSRLHQRLEVPSPIHRVARRRGKQGGKSPRQTLRRIQTFTRKGLIQDDLLSAWIKPVECPVWMTEAIYAKLPGEMTVRIVAYHLKTPGLRTKRITLVTTLLDSTKYPANQLAALYQRRWEIEGHLRELKTTMRMDVLRTKTVDGVTKELLVYVMAYNLVRLKMLEAARRQGVPVERVSFVDALRWLAENHNAHEFEELILNPLRPGRAQPRAVKRRPKSYKLLTEPRREWLKRTMKQGKAA